MLSYNLTKQMRLILVRTDEAVAMVAASAGSVASHYIKPRTSWTIPRM